MGRIETVRAATDEELETQRIYTNITKLKADSRSLLLTAQAGPENQTDSRQARLVMEVSPEGEDNGRRDTEPSMASVSANTPGTQSDHSENSGAEKSAAKAKDRKPARK